MGEAKKVFVVDGGKSQIPEILKQYRTELAADWTKEYLQVGLDTRLEAGEVEGQIKLLLGLLQECAERGDLSRIEAPEWAPVREFLATLSTTRALQGFTSTQTAKFVFSFKKPLFARLAQSSLDVESLSRETWIATELMDALGLHTIACFQKSREDIIGRQQEELLELSTPVVKLWEGVLALPMIGTLDSSRTQMVMESLLQKIVDTGSELAIIDITGVPTVDTLVAQYLLKTVAAIRLMGADCIISGVRPQIAQTIVHLGVDLHGVTTKASLADALALALKRTGFVVSRPNR